MAYPFDNLGDYNVVRNALKLMELRRFCSKILDPLLPQKKDPKYSKMAT